MLETKKGPLSFSYDSLLKLYISLLVICIPAEPMLPYAVRWMLIIFGAGLVLLYVRKIRLTSYIIFQAFFSIMLVFSLFYTPKGADGMGIIIQNTRAFIQSAVIILLVQGVKGSIISRVRLILDSFAIGTVIILIYTLFVERDYVFGGSGYWRLGNAVFENFGTFMMLSYSVIISIIWTAFNMFEAESKRKLYLVMSVVLLIGGALTGTKKIFAAIGISAILYILIKYRKKGLKMIAALTGICVLIVAAYLILVNNDFLYVKIGYRLENYLLVLQGAAEGSESTESRAWMREYGMKMFAQSPVIGHGVSSFRWFFYLQYGQFLYSHCNFVELLCNHGLVGFLLYYGYYVWLLVKSFGRFLHEKKVIYMFITIFLVNLFILDYGQVSYYRVHYMLISQVIAYMMLEESRELKEIN